MSQAPTIRAALEQRDPDASLILDVSGSMMSTRTVLGAADTITSALRMAGLDAHSRVAVVVPNGPLAAITALAVMSATACAPLNPRYGVDEFADAFRDLGADALVTTDAAAPSAQRVALDAGLAVLHVQLDGSSTAGVAAKLHSASQRATRGRERDDDSSSSSRFAMLLHTSGTTARPKLIGLTEANLLSSALSVATTLELSAADRCLNVMPLFHIHGLVGALLASVGGGGSIVCAPGFDAFAFRRQLSEPGVTWTTAVPSMYQALLLRNRNAPGVSPPENLRFVRSSSATMPVALWHGIEALLGCPLINAYGMTEASHQVTSNPVPPGERRYATVGRSAGAQIAIAVSHDRINGGEPLRVTQAGGAIGEVVILGHGVMAGYLAPEGADEHSWIEDLGGRWFRTGDLGELDGDGYLRLIGRIKEIINVGGEKVSPFEVEAVLMQHPAVADAVAFAAPCPLRGEQVYAAVTLHHDLGDTPSPSEVRRFAAARLARFKTPERVVFVSEIPLGATGKVQRARLAGLLDLTESG